MGGPPQLGGIFAGVGMPTLKKTGGGVRTGECTAREIVAALRARPTPGACSFRAALHFCTARTLADHICPPIRQARHLVLPLALQLPHDQAQPLHRLVHP